MTDTSRLAQMLDEIVRLTQTMADAAGNGDWQTVVSLEVQRRASYIEVLQQAREQALPAALAPQLRTLQELENQLRGQIEARLEGLQGEIQSVNNEQKLLRAYGP